MYVGSEVLLDGDSGFFLFFLFWLFGSFVRDAPTPSPPPPQKKKRTERRMGIKCSVQYRNGNLSTWFFWGFFLKQLLM